ncbi:MAG: diphthine synthase [Candidatus Aenigmarchaeota archaeon]|nr:diphthine synthase [Candidatus Aenigmarchaeota archaeon]MDW8160281.1 diphthine synthase [Candidatus Aenigmarchaeota archaeon]
MLVLAGLGLGNEKSITLEELEEAKKADEVYLERYTNIWLGDLENLEKMIGKKIGLLSRKDLEEESHKIVERAKEKNILVFVPGDPLVATTHLSLVKECMEKNVGYKIYHNASIISSIGETGLHLYKFGKTVTLPLEVRGKNFDSVIESIKNNKKLGLHTLCLLDIDVERNEFLTVREGIRFLLKNKAIAEDEEIVVASCLGTDDKKIFYGKANFLVERTFSLPAVIIVIGELHFSEREFLEKFRI